MSLQVILDRSHHLQQQLEDFVAKTPEIEENYPHYDTFAAFAQKIADITAEAKKPARIGLVGGFNSGKTLALGSLLGVAGQLPVSESPTTGNIVEFRMFRDETATESQLENWRVEMMNTADLKNIRDKLLKEAKGLAGLEGIHWPSTLENSERLDWNDVLVFTRETHPKARANKLKSVCFELYRLVYVYNGGSKHFGIEYPINQDQAKKLMTLDYDPKDVDKPLDEFDLSLSSFDDVTDIFCLSVESLSKFFGLVKKITVDVRSTPAAFDRFSASGMQEFLFVDCPGYGADTSSIRDQTLCAVELENIDCILVFLNALTPGSSREYVDSARRFWGKDVNERLVVTVSRFDEIRLNDAAGQIRTELAKDVTLTNPKVLSTFDDTLETLMKQAESTVVSVNHENVCLFSATAYIDMMAQTSSLYLGTEAFLDEKIRSVPGALERPWRAECRYWEAVGKTLLRNTESSGQPSGLGKLLSEFGYDGGGQRLIAMLCRHVEVHGAKNKESRLLPKLNRLETQFRKEVEPMFHDWLAKRKEYEPEPDKTGDSSSMLLAEVVEQLQMLAGNLKQFRNAFIAKGMGAFHFSLVFRNKDEKKIKFVSGLKRVLIDKICRWSEWDALFRYMDDEVLVKFVDDSTARERRIPLKSDAFFDPFIEILRGLQVNFREVAAKVIQFNFDELGEMLEEKNELRGGTMEDTEKLCRALQYEGVRQELRKKALFSSDWCKNPTWDQIGLLFADLGKNMDIPLIHDDNEPVKFYPLQRGSDKGGTGAARTFPWLKSHHDEYSRHFSNENRHLTTVLQMRQVLIDAAVYFLDASAGALEKKLWSAIEKRLGQLNDELGNTIKALNEKLKGSSYPRGSGSGGLVNVDEL